MRLRKETSGLLPWVSALYLLTAVIGAVMAIREDLPGEFADITSGNSASADFFRGTGTALSPGLTMLCAHMIFMGLIMLGAAATVGMVGEPIAYRVLSRKGFDPPKAVLVSALIVLPSSMSLLGIKRLLTISSER